MATEDQIRSLEKKVEELTNQVGKLQDTQAVRDLQFKYGYYLDKCLYDEVVDLFTDDCEVTSSAAFSAAKQARAVSIATASAKTSLTTTTGRCPASCSII